jgi:hypothetical protein
MGGGGDCRRLVSRVYSAEAKLCDLKFIDICDVGTVPANTDKRNTKFSYHRSLSHGMMNASVVAANIYKYLFIYIYGVNTHIHTQIYLPVRACLCMCMNACLHRSGKLHVQTSQGERWDQNNDLLSSNCMSETCPCIATDRQIGYTIGNQAKPRKDSKNKLYILLI